MESDVISPTLVPSIPYNDPRRAIQWLTDVLGFRAGAVHEEADGTIAHAELAWRTGVVYLGPRGAHTLWSTVGPASIALATEDAATIDRYYERAQSAGAEITRPLHDAPYGSHQFELRDPEGNFWTVGTYRARIPAGESEQ